MPTSKSFNPATDFVRRKLHKTRPEFSDNGETARHDSSIPTWA